MSAKAITAGLGMWLSLIAGSITAQDSSLMFPVRPAMSSDPANPVGQAPTDTKDSEKKPGDAPVPAITQPPQLPPGSVSSPWGGPGGTGCCGPVGGNGPILTELVLRSGINLPVAGGIMNNVTSAGYIQTFGARSMFFNPEGSASWTCEIAIDYIFNNGHRTDVEFDIFGTFASIREYHRAGVHVTFGREIYTYAPAYQPSKNFRFGWDVGGRWAMSRANLNVVTDADPPTIDFARRYDVYGGLLISLHCDYEWALSCCKTFLVGIRTEWCYNWSDIIPTYDSNLQDVNIMLNFGWRF